MATSAFRETASQTLNIRVSPTVRKQITKLAKQRKLTTTEYVLRAALGELDDAQSHDDAERFERLEERLRRLEDLTFGS